MSKIKTKLTIQAFLGTQSIRPLILSLKIPEEPLIPPPSKLFITEPSHQIISSIFGKGDNP